MTYFGFLGRFLILPIIALGLLTIWDWRRGKALPDALRGWSPVRAVATLIVIAVVYTTPWDNYLVATRVWWYDPQLVTGIILGWVPLEEYLFFVLQPVMVALWMLLLARHLPAARRTISGPFRAVPVIIGVCVWIIALVNLLSGWQPGKYLGLELVWALPPILLQLRFGIDILLHHRRLVLLTIVPTTIYLSLADSLAISSGIWTIHPEYSLGVFLGEHLPLEEFVFFLLTTMLVTFGLLLAIVTESWNTMRLLMSRTLSSKNQTH